ncbi:hypothetical protein [Pseudomonas fragi]|uniref:Uncharacterized protein n=1 Tax=Pseudomonas fragi TaxID=296 RepID=A0ABT4WW26_PSEFR|nr:hypothetical protein [Pseudomonas fragi]MDA7023362.1 hypothetical protein [Pseudomonas fragi]
MATVKVEAGDIDKGAWQYSGMFGTSILTRASTKDHPWKGETINPGLELERTELLDEEKVKKLAGTAGWGVAGAVLLGPIGAIGGMLLGGNKKEVAFAAYLKDGRKFMATTDGGTWKKLMAITF